MPPIRPRSGLRDPAPMKFAVAVAMTRLTGEHVAEVQRRLAVRHTLRHGVQGLALDQHTLRTVFHEASAESVHAVWRVLRGPRPTCDMTEVRHRASLPSAHAEHAWLRSHATARS